MPRKAKADIPRHGKFTEFDLLRGQLLLGEYLRDVRILENSIARFGLLTPLIAIERSGRLAVIDGSKRLNAIRRLAFQGRLPSSLSRLPYFLLSETSRTTPAASFIVSNASLFDAIQKQYEVGNSLESMANAFQISRQCVRDLLSLKRVSPTIRAAFFKRSINVPQVRAYAAIPSFHVQDICLLHLGTEATPEQIFMEAPGPVS